MGQATTLFRGEHLSVVEYICTSGPDDAPFVEAHARHSLSFVRSGSFGCTQRGRTHEMVAGSVMVGHPGDEYMCSHEHGCGDECLSFHWSAEHADALGLTANDWRSGAVPPMSEVMVVAELALAAASGRSDVAMDEAGVLFTERLARVMSGKRRPHKTMTLRDRSRAVDAARWLEERSTDTISLDELARRSGLSAFHFLRTFAQVIGATPHQYLLRCRLRHAARLLIDTDIDAAPKYRADAKHNERAITDIALDVGFADLSNFVRTFHRAAGVTPREFRRASRGDRKILQERLAAI